MARAGSGDSFDIGTWADGDNPGAGSQNFAVFSDTGLNGNFKRFWRAIKLLLKVDGTLNDDQIDGNAIKASAVDGSTLETSAATGAKTLRVKDGGIVAAKIGAGAVITAKLATDSVDNTILKDDASVDANRAVTTDHLRDASVTAAKLASDSVTAPKITHDNNRTKFLLVFTLNSLTGTVYGFVNNIQLTALLGIPMPRAGSITRAKVIEGNGTVYTVSYNYGIKTFAVDAKMQGNFDDGIGVYWRYVGGADEVISSTPTTTNCIIVLEGEFDD